MARKKLSEFRSKQLLFNALGNPYNGISLNDRSKQELKKLDPLNKTENYVVKVDQAVKKRGKQGLIAIKVSPYKIKETVEGFFAKGYRQFLVEEFIPHEKQEEKYLSFERTREGIVARYSLKGGIDVEEYQDEIKTFTLSNPFDKNTIEKIDIYLTTPKGFLEKTLDFFETNYVSFLEINPLVIKKNLNSGHLSQPHPNPLLKGEGKQGEVFILDLAVEVDSSAEFFVKNGWKNSDFVEFSSSAKTPQEIAVEKLKENSQASFTLKVFNTDGSIFVLLSGGGASITVADEIYNQGYAKELANYADYSGNPNQEETYLYTKELLQLLFASKAKKKTLLIAGGVANFTDIRITFRGILKAFEEVKDKLKQQHVHIFVRRGGPNQQEGLQLMSDFLRKNSITGEVYDQDMILTGLVHKAIEYIKS